MGLGGVLAELLTGGEHPSSRGSSAVDAVVSVPGGSGDAEQRTGERGHGDGDRARGSAPVEHA
jgi:hypothetical protein